MKTVGRKIHGIANADNRSKNVRKDSRNSSHRYSNMTTWVVENGHIWRHHRGQRDRAVNSVTNRSSLTIFGQARTWMVCWRSHSTWRTAFTGAVLEARISPTHSPPVYFCILVPTNNSRDMMN